MSTDAIPFAKHSSSVPADPNAPKVRWGTDAISGQMGQLGVQLPEGSENQQFVYIENPLASPGTPTTVSVTVGGVVRSGLGSFDTEDPEEQPVAFTLQDWVIADIGKIIVITVTNSAGSASASIPINGLWEDLVRSSAGHPAFKASAWTINQPLVFSDDASQAANSTTGFGGGVQLKKNTEIKFNRQSNFTVEVFKPQFQIVLPTDKSIVTVSWKKNGQEVDSADVVGPNLLPGPPSEMNIELYDEPVNVGDQLEVSITGKVGVGATGPDSDHEPLLTQTLFSLPVQGQNNDPVAVTTAGFTKNGDPIKQFSSATGNVITHINSGDIFSITDVASNGSAWITIMDDLGQTTNGNWYAINLLTDEKVFIAKRNPEGGGVNKNIVLSGEDEFYKIEDGELQRWKIGGTAPISKKTLIDFAAIAKPTSVTLDPGILRWELSAGSMLSNPFLTVYDQTYAHEGVVAFDKTTCGLSEAWWFADSMALGEDAGSVFSTNKTAWRGHNTVAVEGGVLCGIIAIDADGDGNLNESDDNTQHVQVWMPLTLGPAVQVEPGSPGSSNVWSHPSFAMRKGKLIVSYGDAPSGNWKVEEYDNYPPTLNDRTLLQEVTPAEMQQYFPDETNPNAQGHHHSSISVDGNFAAATLINFTNQPRDVVLVRMQLDTGEVECLREGILSYSDVLNGQSNPFAFITSPRGSQNVAGTWFVHHEWNGTRNLVKVFPAEALPAAVNPPPPLFVETDAAKPWFESPGGFAAQLQQKALKQNTTELYSTFSFMAYRSLYRKTGDVYYWNEFKALFDIWRSGATFDVARDETPTGNYPQPPFTAPWIRYGAEHPMYYRYDWSVVPNPKQLRHLGIYTSPFLLDVINGTANLPQAEIDWAADAYQFLRLLVFERLITRYGTDDRNVEAMVNSAVSRTKGANCQLPGYWSSQSILGVTALMVDEELRKAVGNAPYLYQSEATNGPTSSHQVNMDFVAHYNAWKATTSVEADGALLWDVGPGSQVNKTCGWSDGGDHPAPSTSHCNRHANMVRLALEFGIETDLNFVRALAKTWSKRINLGLSYQTQEGLHEGKIAGTPQLANYIDGEIENFSFRKGWGSPSGYYTATPPDGSNEGMNSHCFFGWGQLAGVYDDDARDQLYLLANDVIENPVRANSDVKKTGTWQRHSSIYGKVGMLGVVAEIEHRRSLL